MIKEDVKPGYAPEEISFGGYTTKNLHHSADAAKAFQDTIERFGKTHPKDVLAALKHTDDYMKLNDLHLEQGKAPDEAELKAWRHAHTEARNMLNKVGEFMHHEDYWHMHEHEIQDLETKFTPATAGAEMADSHEPQGNQLDEAIKIGTKVKIHAPGKDYHGEVGHVGEIRHGAYKGAPKTYTVDYADRKSVQLDKKNIKAHKEAVAEELTDKTIKSGDKVKVARVVADMLGVENAETMSPDVAVNTGLRKIKSKRMTPELVGVVKKMLALAAEVGIKVDQSLVPKAVSEETITELKRDTLKSYIAKSMGSKSAADFTRGVKMAQGSGGDEELRAKSEKRSAGIHTAIKKLTKEETDLQEADVVNTSSKRNIAKDILRLKDYTKLKHIQDQAGHPEEPDTEVDGENPSEVGNTLDTGDKDHIRRMKIAYKTEEVELEESEDYSVTVNHYKDGEKTDHEYIVKNANNRRHAKNIAMLRHEKKVGALKPGEKYGTDSMQVKTLAKESVELEEAADAASLRKQIDKHTELAVKANRAGDDEAVKKHQGHINKFKTQLAKLVRSEEVELEEGKMGELHATISKHLDKHISDFKSGHTGMDQFGSKVLSAHKSVAKEHGLEHKHAAKMVNDYVDSKLNEELEEGKIANIAAAAVLGAATLGAGHHVVNKIKEPTQSVQQVKKNLSQLTPMHRAQRAGEFVKKILTKEETLDEVSDQTLDKAWHGRYQQALAAKRGSPEHQKAHKSMGKIGDVMKKRIDNKLMHMAKHDPEAYKKSAVASADQDRKRGWSTEEVELEEGVFGDPVVPNKKATLQALEDLQSADYKTTASGHKYRARHINFAASKGNAAPVEGDDTSGEKSERKTKKNEPIIKPVKEEVEDEYDDVSTESDLDDMVKQIEDEEDILDAYDDDELVIVDDETGEVIDDMKEEFNQINEVMSRTERMRAKVRFARTASKRERRVKLALKQHSSSTTINKRARRLAINILKQRIMKKPASQLSVGEKERVERMLAKRKNLINRLSMKLAPRVRKIENERLSHSKVTK